MKTTLPVKTLPEILRDAILLLEFDIDRENVVIARGQQLEAFEGQALRLLQCEAFQIRLWRETSDSADTDLFRSEARMWFSGGWSAWKKCHSWRDGASFDISDVLATDWRIAS